MATRSLQKVIRLHSIFVIFSLLTFTIASSFAADLNELKQNFKNPPAACWPHTRWWWPGNPVSKDEITWQLEQMRAVGITGVEQITMGEVYEKGNIPYLSDEFLEMIKHTVKEAKRLGMEVSLNFGGPGWIIGGDWVPEKDLSKDMIPTFIDLVGPQTFHGPLPDKLIKTQRSWEIYHPYLSADDSLLTVVAGRVIDNKITEQSLRILTTQVRDKWLEWQVPEGHWRLMAFWLAKNGHSNAVDHFNKAAMKRYCNYLGGKFYSVVGAEFGKTMDSFFCDSFELPNLASGIYWSTGLLEEFQQYKGYDLTPYLPAIWWQVGEITPKIRYDVNQFLHHVGLEAFFRTFLDWCAGHNIKGRIQAYGFTTDIIEGSGMADIPEMEITPGEKDAAPWFDTRIGPKKYVASGAHIYGRNVVSVEAYTFMHWERYRATLEDLKIATDGFLRSGATKFYNHGYSYLPEREVSPSRTMPWAPQTNPTNIWWKYYPHLTEYIARCSYLFQKSDFAPDIAIYSPLANQWTLNVLNPRKWTREFDWGDLGFLLISNGYDFDLLNDDALQNIAKIENGHIKIRNMEYKVLLLPNIAALPLKTLEFIERYVREGGVVIALERLPESSTGFIDYETKDKNVQSMVSSMFVEPFGWGEVGTVKYGKGYTYCIKQVIDRKIWWDQRSAILDPFIKTIQKHIKPDFGIDFAYEGIRKNEGLTFLHKKHNDVDIYFVTNIQDKQSSMPITFRVKNKKVFEWNPYNGQMTEVLYYSQNKIGTSIPLNLAPYQSTILVFEPEKIVSYVEKTNFDQILNLKDRELVALAKENGNYLAKISANGAKITMHTSIRDIPAPLEILGDWHVTFEGWKFPKFDTTMSYLSSWSEIPRTKHFSGTVRYGVTFNFPENMISGDNIFRLDLGKVGNIAEVYLNDIAVGTVWIRGQILDITEAIKPGENILVCWITNTLINRISAFKEAPPVPAELIPRFGSGTTAHSARKQPEFGFEPLPPSGLMGPVRIITYKKLAIPIQ